MKTLNSNLQLGQSIAEYGLLLALIAIVALAVLTRFGGQLEKKFQIASTCLENSQTTTATGTAPSGTTTCK